jgi:hypothetical protein
MNEILKTCETNVGITSVSQHLLIVGRLNDKEKVKRITACLIHRRPLPGQESGIDVKIKNR